jgi:hypothetical protein
MKPVLRFKREVPIIVLAADPPQVSVNPFTKLSSSAPAILSTR